MKTTAFRNKLGRIIALILTCIMVLCAFSLPASAMDDGTGNTSQIASEEASSDATLESKESDSEETAEVNEAAEVSNETSAKDTDNALELNANSVTISGTFAKKSGYDVATVRYYTNAEKTEYAFAEFTETSSGYSYSFDAPYDEFTKVEGTSKDDSDATIIAEYYSTTKWDGAVDVTWYNEKDTSFNISTPAQLAGLAAIVNGSINNSTPIYRVKGTRADYSKTYDYDTPQTSSDYKKLSGSALTEKLKNINEGLPTCIKNTYKEKTNLIASVEDEAYVGLAENDFSNKTVNITADLDMGGTDPSNIDHSKNWSSSTMDGENYYEGTYPNWTPIGGEYLMDPSDASTMIIASFNGTINGNGHNITNLYCYRWSYRSVGDTAYGYAQGTGLVGMMGSLYDGEENPTVMPGLRNMSLSGYIFGRRMVGGFVGCLGGGSNAASGTSVAGGITFENLANHAEIHCTDSKGLGGIVACAMVDSGNIINCYNKGNLTADYAAPSGGIVGSNEGLNVFCCYNTGKITAQSNRGRSIGCNNDGNANAYTVSDCYYLEGSNNDPDNPGYYRGTASKKVSVTTEEMTSSQMKSGELLEKLNVNGTAYVECDDGYPVLYWEKNPSIGSGSLTISTEGENKHITATKSGTQKNGTISYFDCNPSNGVKCRYYELNGNKLSGNYVTINGTNNVITANFEEILPGTLKLQANDLVDVTVTKDGIIKKADETTEEVSNYPVNDGDPLYEGDLIAVKARIKKGNTPEDENLEYEANLEEKFQTQPYTYTFSYRDGDNEIIGDEVSSDVQTFTVGSEIAGDEVTLSLGVSLKTTPKMWDHIADTSWYNDSDTTFTITNANELAGLSVLVDEGNNFAGKTIVLGNDISLRNNDGTSGTRYWDGIGSATGTGFAGTFDGIGKQITDYNGNRYGLFEYCAGESTDSKAVIKNLTLKGTSEGQNACGFIYQAKNTTVENCVSYCTVKGNSSSSCSAAIIGDTNLGNCTISYCYNYAPIYGKGFVGGIVGRLGITSYVKDCINNGNITSIGTTSKIGGLIGDLNGKIYTSGNYGNISGNGMYIGGIAGQSTNSNSVIDSCYNVGTLTFEGGNNTYNAIGGILGYAFKYDVRNSFNYGEIRVEPAAIVSTSNIGGTFGRQMSRSESKTYNVYYLDTTCAYAQAGTAYEDLDTTAKYAEGIKVATAEKFASSGSDGVLAAINTSGDNAGESEGNAFILNTDAEYPEVKATMNGLHVHIGGGKATCSTLPVCEICGMTYGTYSDIHGETKTVNASESVWNIDGYTGDIVCTDCGKTLQKGSVIPADTSATAMTVEVKRSSKTISTKNYSIKEFDALKVTGKPLGYSYGTKSKEIMVAGEYVTLATLLEQENLTLDDIKSIDVICGSSKSNVSADTLKSCNKYYDSEGTESSAEATFSILWNTGSPGDNGGGTITTISDISSHAKNNGAIRFGYGISKEQYDSKESVGGARLVSPVNSLVINLAEPKVLYNGTEMNLSSAIEAANESGGTITLQGDLDTGNDGFVIDANGQDVTLDLAGYTISSNTEYCIEVKSGNLTITNGSIEGKINASDDASITVKDGVTCDYQLEKEYCGDDGVVEYDSETGKYNVVSKSVWEANHEANLLKIQLAELEAKLTALKNQLAAKQKLYDVDVKITAKATDYKTIAVSWSVASDSVSAEAIKLIVQKKENGDWVDLDSSSNSYTDVGEAGIKTEYRIAAQIAYEGASGTEYETGAYVYSAATPSMGKAAISKVTTKSKKLTITWGKVAGAAGYDVYVGTNSAVTKGLVKYTNIKSTSTTTRALKKNTTYYVKVRARYTNSKGEIVYGAWSTVKKIKCK